MRALWMVMAVSAGLVAAGCDATSPGLGRLSPKLATPTGGTDTTNEVPGGPVRPMLPAANAPAGRKGEASATPPPALAPVARPVHEEKLEADLGNVDLPVKAERPPVLASADSGGAPMLVNTVLAQINSEVITREDILGPLRPQMEQWRKELSPPAFDTRCRQIIEMKLREEISSRLVLQEAKASLSDKEKEEVEAMVGMNVKDLASEAGSKHALEMKMKSEGLSVETEKTKQRDRLVVQRFLRSKIAPDVHVTHSELLNYYNEVRCERYEQPLKVRLALITLKKSESAGAEQAKALAEAVYGRAASGEDFAKLAQRYSQDPMAATGGDWGLLSQGAFKVKPVEDALFKLQAGQVAPLVETDEAFYIVKAPERQEVRTVPFTEVQAVVENEIREKKFNTMVSNYINQLYKRAYVHIMMENL